MSLWFDSQKLLSPPLSPEKPSKIVCSTGMVKGAHPFPLSKVIGRCKAASSSITSVLYLKDEITIATAGAPDRYFHNAD
ncbi:hypothetical protein YC2023_103039 [Brassica napus]